MRISIAGNLTRLLVGAVILLSAPFAFSDDLPARVPLVDTKVAQTESSREILKYLVNCALDEKTIVVANIDGQSFEYPGDIGLAPQWQTRGLDESEKRWVSACILARTNFYGVTVKISMVSQFESNVAGLQVTDVEANEYTLSEATFFGNVFDDDPVSYVCGPARTKARIKALTARRRVCSLPKTSGNRLDLTLCGMVYVGTCKPSAFTQKGVKYREAIAVFLPAKVPQHSAEQH